MAAAPLVVAAAAAARAATWLLLLLLLALDQCPGAHNLGPLRQRGTSHHDTPSNILNAGQPSSLGGGSTSAARPSRRSMSTLPSAQAQVLTDDDFIVVQYSCRKRLHLAQASRVWRQGVRTFIAIEDAALVKELNAGKAARRHRETYVYWEEGSRAGGTSRGAISGDTRGALAPFLAYMHYTEHEHAVPFKWILYGDDDTQFYMRGVRKMLKDFDHTLPYVISDHLWYAGGHPNANARRCLPCHFKDMDRIKLKAEFTPRPACPYCGSSWACGFYNQSGPDCSDLHGPSTSAGNQRQQATKHVHHKRHHRRRDASGGGGTGTPTAALASQDGPTDAGGGAGPQQQPDVSEPRRRGRRRLQKRAKKPPFENKLQPHSEFTEEMEYPPELELGSHKNHSKGWQRNRFKAHMHPRVDRCSARLYRLQHDGSQLRCKACGSAHGGAGIVISVGFFRLVDPMAMSHFILDTYGCSGSDCLFTKALWSQARMGYTDPGLALLVAPDEASYGQYTIFSDRTGAPRGVMNDPAGAVLSGQCGELCRYLVDNVVSSHVRGRAVSADESVPYLQNRTESYLRAVELLGLDP